jgi:hypothetical protein
MTVYKKCGSVSVKVSIVERITSTGIPVTATAEYQITD